MKNVFKLITLLFALGAVLPLHATPTAAPDTWGGDFASRPRLTGDWGGVRDDMADKGVTLDVDTYWMPQTILSGGKDETSASWGNVITALKVDTGKAGMWKGGHFKVQTVTSFGNNLISETGTFVPANLSWLLPSVAESRDTHDLPREEKAETLTTERIESRDTHDLPRMNYRESRRESRDTHDLPRIN